VSSGGAVPDEAAISVVTLAELEPGFAWRRPKVQDTWIAATARAHDAAVYTQDSDFDHLAVDVVRV
jgi:predicted nuclease of predicted toxin-antitoxin system